MISHSFSVWRAELPIIWTCIQPKKTVSLFKLDKTLRHICSISLELQISTDLLLRGWSLLSTLQLLHSAPQVVLLLWRAVMQSAQVTAMFTLSQQVATWTNSMFHIWLTFFIFCACVHLLTRNGWHRACPGAAVPRRFRRSCTQWDHLC